MNRLKKGVLLGLVFLSIIGIGIGVLFWTNGFSFSMGSVSFRDNASSSLPVESSSPFERVIELGTGSLPLRSQHAIAEWNGSPLIVFTNDDYIYLADVNGALYQVALLEKGAQSPTLATHEGQAVVAWVTPEAILSSSSTDLMEWTEPIIVGVREQDGGPIPSIDWTGTEFAVVWVDAPNTNESTGAMDGVGTLQLATGNGVDDWTLKSINQTSAIVSISGSTLVWRDDRAEAGSRFDTLYMQNIYEGEEGVVGTGYDPAVAVEGDSIAIGYHLGAEAHLRTSLDGGVTWSDEILDPSGKFVTPMVSDGVFGAVWVDYTNAESAKDARNNSGHRTTAVWDDVTYLMNEGQTYTLQGQGTVIQGVPVSVYQVDGVLFLAY